MLIKAQQTGAWITPRKLRQVADVVRGKDLAEINTILSGLNKHGAQVINETIRQAVANAVNNLGLPEESLTLKALQVDEGPRYKRYRAGARGRAKPYVLRTSHITVVLESPEEKEAPAAPKPADKQANSKQNEVVKDKKESKTTKKTKSTKSKATARTSVSKSAGAKKVTSAGKKTHGTTPAKKAKTTKSTKTKKTTTEK